MKCVLLCFCVLSAFPALSAFDSTVWHEQREIFAREAERLRICYTNCQAQLLSPASDVSVPIETFEDGSVKTFVKAGRAQLFLAENLVWAEDVRVKRLNADGSVEAMLTATNCVIDRVSKSGWAEGPATVVHGKTSFAGEGVYFSSADAYVKVFDRAQVESSDLKLGRFPAKEESGVLRVKSRACDFDREAGLALFEGNVVVTYTDAYTMCADRLYLFISGTNELNRVVAVGAVSVTNEQRVGTCSLAVYRHRKNEIEMFGDGKEVVARLQDFGRDERAAVTGGRIRFWLDDEQVEVDRSTVTFDAPSMDEQKKRLGH